uniref:winged helix domain-containing protein n=1 Tax=Xenophilus sp. TaxID=1873499 RepID=UPI0037DBF98F
LYLPPRYAHDGVAVGGDCMTCSIGLRAATDAELAADLLARLADAAGDEADGGRRYADPAQAAVEATCAVPEALQRFARDAVRRLLAADADIDRALGESLTEPKPNVWFEGAAAPAPLRGVRLDRRTRMLHDARHVFINGESFRAAGRDARLMRQLADRRRLGAAELRLASEEAKALLADWCEAGWLHGE